MRGAFDASLAVIAGMSSRTRRPTASNVGASPSRRRFAILREELKAACAEIKELSKKLRRLRTNELWRNRVF